MVVPNVISSPFLEKLTQIVHANLTNEQFGVEDLARRVGMSRAQLHRKLNAVTGQSVSQFIREYRLQQSLELLKKGDLTAVEVAEQVGFGSATYFNKCFSEYYGYPPGEFKSRVLEQPIAPAEPMAIPSKKKTFSLQKIRYFAVLALGILATWVYFQYSSRAIIVADDKSIAVLPFKNLSADESNAYFGEGVIEAIRTGLSQIETLRVISGTSVEQYRESAKSARDIANELGVSALLEGTIQRENNRVRIDVRLVDGTTEALVWAKSYDRELKDIFAIQNEIANQVADELNTKLSAEEKSKLSRSDTDNPKAYDLYLRAVYEYRTYTNTGAHNAIELLTEAIALDPNYARAHAFLANSYIGLASIWGAELSALEALKKGKPYIDRALELDPNLDEAHMLMAFYLLYNNWDFQEAEKHYKIGIVSEHPDAMALYADYLNFMSRHEEAMAIAERLNEKNPYYPNSRIVLTYVYNNRMDEALEFSNSRLKMFNNYYTFDAHGFLLLNMKRYDEAVIYFDKAMALEGIRYPRMLGWMGAAYAKNGDMKKAQDIITELKARLHKSDEGSVAFFIAVIYAALNDKDSALTWLETAFQSHDMEMPWLMTEPQFYNLHKEPRFLEIARAIGFDV